jgi:hypothetical protein
MFMNYEQIIGKAFLGLGKGGTGDARVMSDE